MSRPPRFDDTAIKALGLGRLPATFDRAGRVRLLGEFAEAALAGREPSRESLIFIAGAVRAWLENGGDLERNYLRVIANGSHNTPARMWKTLQAPLKGTTDSESPDTLTSSSFESE